MAKKNKNNNNNKRIIPIDCIPKHSQQPRSSPPKRRTDFSVFTSSPASLSNQGSSPVSSSDEVRLSSVTASKLRERRMAAKQFLEDILVRCRNSLDGRPVCASESCDVSVIEVDSPLQDEGLDRNGNSDASNEKSDIFKMSESTPHESSVSDSSSLSVTPGSVVWARTVCQIWWPAEIMEERSALSDSVSDGHVLVQFYGNHPSAWIDPMTDISTFEDSWVGELSGFLHKALLSKYFEERSKNPSKDFQEALKQALKRKEQLSSCQKSTPDMSAHSDQKDGSSGSDKWTSPTSSRTMCDSVEKRRGTRERKRKVHFDEVTCPMKPEKKLRRLKIMRLLGLAPPVGSPF